MPDVVRAGGADPFEYRAPTPAGVAAIQRIRGECRSLAESIKAVTPASRERSLALTKLEEVSMWANKAVVFNPDVETGK